MIPQASELTLKQKIAQLLFIRMGSNLPPIVTASEDEQRVAGVLDACPIGGLLLFNGEWPAVRDSLSRLQAKCRIPMLVAADLERGAGQQVHGLTVFPHARAFAEFGEQSADAIRRAQAITSAEALQSGVQILFAPVADANTNPKNPIIATRAYGERPEAVARLVAAAVEAINDAGALASAKHFPGHGDTSQDSHAELPSVDRTAAELHAAELAPFRAAIDAGTPIIMSAHVSYPGLDPTGEPATFSRPILVDLLRGELGFEGAVCSDSLLMAGARDRYETEGQMAAAALTAGVDMLLDVADPAAVTADLAQQVRDGRLAEARVDEALARVLRLKQRCAPVTPHTAELPAATREEHEAFAETVASGAIRVTGGPAPQLDPGKSTAAVLMKPFNLPTDPPEQALAAALRERLPGVAYLELGPEIPPEAAAQTLAKAGECDQLLLAIIAKPAAWHAFGMSPDQARLAERLAEHPGVVVASLGVPTLLDDFPGDAPKLCTFSDVPDSQAAVADLLTS